VSKSRKPFQKIVAKLEVFYGQPKPPRTTDPFEMILLENVAYLVGDEQRTEAFDALADRVGLSPVDIVTAPEEKLLEVARLGGMLPASRVDKLRRVADIALQEFEGDLESILALPAPKAKRALKKFPGIGDPGAEKILLFTRTYPVLALESNGLRATLRLGYGEERKTYSATYRSVQQAVEPELPKDFDWLIEAHQLLRRHGQELCKRSEPRCVECPVKLNCRFYQLSRSTVRIG
jgi:endonuclease III